MALSKAEGDLQAPNVSADGSGCHFYRKGILVRHVERID